ncbi:hypothetical protein BpHYR1_028145 [Brachionus plicatilis]|uniref:Uncharacterized protein n=1 Tax=Brachionus plicatilis TaxID=10195 RepID=A0A3M7PPB6_BRAPC|nr:hypothetical protein BpHYR1_028145 [Brachionus plicatilis]
MAQLNTYGYWRQTSWTRKIKTGSSRIAQKKFEQIIVLNWNDEGKEILKNLFTLFTYQTIKAQFYHLRMEAINLYQTAMDGLN